MNTYIALLRGINVGGKNKLPMEALRQCFANAGCFNTRTYIQSGNAVFEAPDHASAVSACRLVEAAILDGFGCKSPVILRSAIELAAVAQNNPFLAVAGQSESDHLHVVFLADTPEPARAASLDPERSPGDEFALINRELYLRLPRGAGETKLTIPYLDSRLKTTGTQRNWRTVLTLAKMGSDIESS